MSIDDYNKRLEEIDRNHIWHPFTQMKDWASESPIIIKEGRDCFVKDTLGRWYLDGVSSLWVNIFGHRRRELDDALKAQIDKIAHSTMLGLGSVASIEYAEELAAVLSESFGGSLTRIFYSDNGSTAVEVGLKTAFQYWSHKDKHKKTKFVSLNNAYHGDTIGAMSVGGVDVFHKTFSPLFFETIKVPSPYCYRCELNLEKSSCRMECLGRMSEILTQQSDAIAAVIVEPMIQCAGGMIVFPQGYMRGLRRICNEHNVLLIADEVATGFGRTGWMFACEHEGIAPDILCLSKGITGGYMPMAVTVSTEEIYSAFLGGFSELKTFFHGHSYTGNPLACAVASACLKIFRDDKVIESMKPKIEMLAAWVMKISMHKNVGDARSIGLMCGVELVKDKSTKEAHPFEEKIGWQVAYRAREMGVIIRPLGSVIVIMPPLTISLENLKRLLDVIEESIYQSLK